MFSTVQDVKDALAPVAPGDPTDQGTAIGLSDAQIEDQINQADGVITAYLSQRYTIPQDDAATQGDPAVSVDVAVVPVRWFSRDIAAYLATLVYFRNKPVQQDHPIRLRYVEVMRLLTDIRSGEASLDLPPAGDGTEDFEPYTANLYEGTLFGPSDFGLTTCPPIMPGRWPGGPGGW